MNTVIQLQGSVGWPLQKKVNVYLVVRIQYKPVLILMGIYHRVAAVGEVTAVLIAGERLLSPQGILCFLNLRAMCLGV